MLSKECKDKISSVITAAEENSDVEIVCVVAEEYSEKNSSPLAQQLP